MSTLVAESLKHEQTYFLSNYNEWLQSYLLEQRKTLKIPTQLLDSMSYSLDLPGKRFRPFLAYLCWKAVAKAPRDIQEITNWCLAIEFVHTYSLIHDDLPCMDNDDFRRGKPSNHKVFGEDTALLAGDALLTESFRLISDDHNLSDFKKVKLVQLLSSKIGAAGMVGGQVLDMQSKPGLSEEQLKKIHNLKTGYLIQTAALGAAYIAEANTSQLDSVSQYALSLGLAFQIKDDLLDGSDSDQDHKSYLTLFGEEKTKQYLQQISLEANLSLKEINSDNLISLIEHNSARET